MVIRCHAPRRIHLVLNVDAYHSTYPPVSRTTFQETSHHSSTMNKSQFYLSQCIESASKSPMLFKLGAVMVKGGKVISTGHNHHRPHYDGGELGTQGLRKVGRNSRQPRSKLRRVCHTARVHACGDARHLQLYRHVSVVQVAGSSDGTISYVQKRDQTVQIIQQTTFATSTTSTVHRARIPASAPRLLSRQTRRSLRRCADVVGPDGRALQSVVD